MPDSLFKYTIQLADSSLIMGHRLSEWTGHGPILEQDIAISNIALDLVGQARNFYQYAALTRNDGGTEDSLAYLRSPNEFKNLLITEIPNGDWAKTVLKIFFFSNYQVLLYTELIYSADKQLAAIAEKSLKEVTYHLRWSSEWVIRLGDGTPESHIRMLRALENIWEYTGGFFIASDAELSLIEKGIAPDVHLLEGDWYKRTATVFTDATLHLPAHYQKNISLKGRKEKHTQYLDTILADMQFLQRAYPGCEW